MTHTVNRAVAPQLTIPANRTLPMVRHMNFSSFASPSMTASFQRDKAAMSAVMHTPERPWTILDSGGEQAAYLAASLA
jgi:hypothetical protein